MARLQPCFQQRRRVRRSPRRRPLDNQQRRASEYEHRGSLGTFGAAFGALAARFKWSADTRSRILIDYANRNISFGSGTATPDVSIERIAADVLGLGVDLGIRERGSDIGAPAADRVRIFSKDNGSDKKVLYARFATGAIVQSAIGP